MNIKFGNKKLTNNLKHILKNLLLNIGFIILLQITLYIFFAYILKSENVKTDFSDLSNFLFFFIFSLPLAIINSIISLVYRSKHKFLRILSYILTVLLIIIIIIIHLFFFGASHTNFVTFD